jgi:flagellar biosynthesis/type III secretory pathway protein FliH
LDDPADVDADEFAPENAKTALCDPLPEVVDEAAAPTVAIVDQVTAPHRLSHSAEFRAGVEVGRAEGEKAGYKKGYERGYEEGRADIKAEDIEAGRELGHDDMRRAMIADGTDPMRALVLKDQLRAWVQKNPA